MREEVPKIENPETENEEKTEDQLVDLPNVGTKAGCPNRKKTEINISKSKIKKNKKIVSHFIEFPPSQNISGFSSLTELEFQNKLRYFESAV